MFVKPSSQTAVSRKLGDCQRENYFLTVLLLMCLLQNLCYELLLQTEPICPFLFLANLNIGLNFFSSDVTAFGITVMHIACLTYSIDFSIMLFIYNIFLKHYSSVNENNNVWTGKGIFTVIFVWLQKQSSSALSITDRITPFTSLYTRNARPFQSYIQAMYYSQQLARNIFYMVFYPLFCICMFSCLQSYH